MLMFKYLQVTKWLFVNQLFVSERLGIVKILLIENLFNRARRVALGRAASCRRTPNSCLGSLHNRNRGFAEAAGELAETKQTSEDAEGYVRWLGNGNEISFQDHCGIANWSESV